MVFLKLDPSYASSHAEVAAKFGDTAFVRCNWNGKIDHWTCVTPPHADPQVVEVSLRVEGKPLPMSLQYSYTTYGKTDIPVLRINTGILQENAKSVMATVPVAIRLGVVLKNGDPVAVYGKILQEVIRVDYFCVPKLQDGIELRKSGIKTPILLLYVDSAENVPQMLHYDLEPAALSPAWVYRANQILEKAAGILKVHLWIDTGMAREGVLPHEALPLGRLIQTSSHLKLAGIGTHFGSICASDRVHLQTNNMKCHTVQQKTRFDLVLQSFQAEGIGLEAVIHAGASEVLRNQLTPLYYQMLRVGSLFFENLQGKQKNYSWTTQIQQIKTLPKGWCIDYGCKQYTQKSTPVGLVGHIPERNGNHMFFIRGKRVQALIDHGIIYLYLKLLFLSVAVMW